MYRRALAVAFVVTLLAGSLQAQRGALVKPRGLEELAQKAARIVHAHVVSARVEPHPQYPTLTTVLVTLHVDETLKGKAAPELTFRQFIWDWRDKQDAAGYRKGRELILFLNKVNEHGLTSPSGMDQGRIEVRRTSEGRAVVTPQSGRRFFQGVDAALAKRGKAASLSMRSAMSDPAQGVDLGDFKSVVRDLAAPVTSQ
jgi:hypothetical protein